MPLCAVCSLLMQSMKQAMEYHVTYPFIVSFQAQIWSFFIIILIIVSVVMFMIETLPKFTKDPEPTFFYIETVIVAVFTFEFIMRIISAPDKVLFVLGVLNWVDFLAIAPYYIELAFVGTPGLAWIRVLRLTRVFRIFKVGRYQYGFLLFYFTFKGSVETLFMGLVFILLGIILFGSFMYYAEQTEASFDDDCTCWIYDDDSLNPGGVSPYQSIPHTFWWCIVTMTTVGYGDHFPITPLGKTVAGITFLSGLLIIAFPIAILGNKFLDLYLEQEERNKAEVRKRKEARFAVHPNERYHHLTDPVENVAQEVDTCKDLIREIHSLLSDLDAKQEEVNRALSLFNVKHNKDLVEVEIQRR
eukprot:TRINITY_DN5874_c0_g1_i1.p1 TRINITY_DN5874_c0_g1~~TRINITY_DN5874_c0_g1_i1.p1  ORF type:complete len:358 (-),score=52.05 TRINITY_DN5874_c0_g1_i1:52-1125(-)